MATPARMLPAVNRGLRLITAPTEPPVSLDDIKKDLRVDHTDDDDLITAFLDAATQWVEERLQKRLMAQTWEMLIDCFPSNEIFLPLVPVQSITSINYKDAAGAAQLLPTTGYYLDNTSRDAWIFPNGAWPATQSVAHAITIRFVVGYESAEEVPQPISQAIRLLVRESYDGTDAEKTVNRLLVNFDRMVA